MKGNAGYRALKALLFVPSRMPLKVRYFLGDVLALVAHRIVRYRLDVVRRNLRGSFPEMGEKQLRKVEKDFYRHLGEIVAESIWFGGCAGNPERLRRSGLVKVADFSPLNELSKGSNGVVVLYSHTGNWEILGGLLEYESGAGRNPFTERNYCVVYKKLTSRAWDMFLKDNRFSIVRSPDSFDGYVESAELARHVLSHRGEGLFYSINNDQRPYKGSKGRVDVCFMGRDCKGMGTAAAIAVKLGYAVAYQRMVREHRGSYRIEYVPLCTDASLSDAAAIVRDYYALVEKDIRECPANYLWTHKRWK